MNNNKRYNTGLFSGIMVSLIVLLSACSGETTVDEYQGSPLHISAVSRASGDITHITEGKIKLYVMTENEKFSEGTFSTGWTNDNNSVFVGEQTQYYIYGFMPSNIANNKTISKPSDGGTYATGADITLEGLPMFPNDDICVVVGVQKVDAAQTVDNYTEPLEGNYSFMSGLNNENYVNLLMDHLYSQLILQFNVDADYNMLRHIKLKSVTLTSTYGETVNASVKFREGSSLGLNTVVYSKNTDDGSGDTKSLEILKSTDDNVLLTTSATDAVFGPFNCAPCTFDANGNNLTLTCTYDVYNVDETTILRSNCTVTNKLKVSGMDHGIRKRLTVSIAPTYLYNLSDDDLNNPIMTIE